MLFLIEYNRNKGQIVTLQRFSDSERTKAETARLKLELSANGSGAEHEVVILEASTEADLRRTHRRYFEDLADLMKFS